jgi:hypothetical protein
VSEESLGRCRIVSPTDFNKDLLEWLDEEADHTVVVLGDNREGAHLLDRITDYEGVYRTFAIGIIWLKLEKVHSGMGTTNCPPGSALSAVEHPLPRAIRVDPCCEN